MRCGSGLEIELRKIQVVNVWATHRPNDCRLEVAIDTAAPAEQKKSGSSCKECHEDAEAAKANATRLIQNITSSEKAV